MTNTTKVVIVLGAGSTNADADTTNEHEKPPINNGFFQNTFEYLNDSKNSLENRYLLLKQFEYIRAYFEIWHGKNICEGENDSLEGVVSDLFREIYEESPSEKPASTVFLEFMKLFSDILGAKTNTIKIDKTKALFQIINFYLKNGVHPQNLTIISFNYDIYLEKTLEKFEVMANLSYPPKRIFLYPFCYKMRFPLPTRPPSPRQGYFRLPLKNQRRGGVSVLKLHGSLNWYSLYPDKGANILGDVFNPKKRIYVSQEKDISSVQMRKYRNRRGTVVKTIPRIIPPVGDKSKIFHSQIQNLWLYANAKLSNANELIIYGYSCPKTDLASKDLFKSALSRNNKINKIMIIDKNADLFQRYQKMFAPKKIDGIYSGASEFLMKNCD